MTMQLLHRIARSNTTDAIRVIRHRAYVAYKSGAMNESTYREVLRYTNRQRNTIRLKTQSVHFPDTEYIVQTMSDRSD